MALLGAGLGGILQTYFLKKLPERSVQHTVGLGVIAWLSVMMAAFVCSIELAVSGTIAFSKASLAMLGVHSLIGIGEGLITVVACFAFAQGSINTTQRWSVSAPLIASGIIAMILSPFASGFPDGLEWVAEKYQFLHDSAPSFVSPLSDYSVSSINDEMISTGLAGLMGVVVTFLIAWGVVRLLTLYRHIETV